MLETIPYKIISNSGKKYAALILVKPLSQKKYSFLHLVLITLDGGDPSQSGTTQIPILVVDANDHPQCSVRMCIGSAFKKCATKHLHLRVRATHQDEGTNAEIMYAFKVQSTHSHFGLDNKIAETKTLNTLDFKEIKK